MQGSAEDVGLILDWMSKIRPPVERRVEAGSRARPVTDAVGDTIR
jgi:hypothetical protein